MHHFHELRIICDLYIHIRSIQNIIVQTYDHIIVTKQCEVFFILMHFFSILEGGVQCGTYHHFKLK